jgi:hypothetical protein
VYPELYILITQITYKVAHRINYQSKVWSITVQSIWLDHHRAESEVNMTTQTKAKCKQNSQFLHLMQCHDTVMQGGSHFNRQPHCLCYNLHCHPTGKRGSHSATTRGKEGRKKESNASAHLVLSAKLCCSLSCITTSMTCNRHKVTTSSPAYNNRSIHICHGK